MLYPRTGLCTGMAEPGWLASEWQARERGRTRPLVRLSPRVQKPEWRSKQSRGLWATRPRRPFAFRDAVAQDVMDARSRLIPACPVRRQAHPRCSPRSGGTGPSQRPFGACACHRRPARAWAPRWLRLSPGRVFSPRGPDIVALLACGAGTTQQPRKRPTGGERARLFCRTCPRVARRCLGTLTRRHEETQACTVGKRSMSCMSSRSTRRRIVPIPGTVCTRDACWRRGVWPP